MSRFVQIHFLTSYPATLLNRDDAGFAKRMRFGGAVRTRVSSQCLKRHWRTFEGEGSLASIGVPATIRSRQTFQRHIVEPLVDRGHEEALVRTLTEALMDKVLGSSAKAKATKADDGPALKTGQVTVLGKPEVDYLRDGVLAPVLAESSDSKTALKALQDRMKDKNLKANLQALQHAAGLSAALFGRMVTSDLLARGDAAVHVAHALTVHEQEVETDYFSAIDDLVSDDGDLGSGHIGNTELTSGLFYGYVVVDVPLLVSNLTGCDPSEWQTQDSTLAGDVLARLVQLVATVSPGAKLGSTAPYARAEAVMVEVGAHQPRTLANAFRRPIDLRGGVEAAYDAMASYVREDDQMYPYEAQRAAAAKHLAPGARDAMRLDDAVRSLPDLCEWARAKALGAA